METAGGLLRAGEIAAASLRLEALILGYVDLAASLGRAPGPAPPERWSHAQETLLVAARAAGIQAIDGPYPEVGDVAGLRLRAEDARARGFDGMGGSPSSTGNHQCGVHSRGRGARACARDPRRAGRRRGARRRRARRRDDRRGKAQACASGDRPRAAPPGSTRRRGEPARAACRARRRARGSRISSPARCSTTHRA